MVNQIRKPVEIKINLLLLIYQILAWTESAKTLKLTMAKKPLKDDEDSLNETA